MDCGVPGAYLMTAPPATRLSDAALWWALAGPDGIPTSTVDQRLEMLQAEGRIRAYGSVWRANVRLPRQLTAGQRDFIEADHTYTRSPDR